MKIYEKPLMEVTTFSNGDSIAALTISATGNVGTGTVGTVTNLTKRSFGSLGSLHS